MKRPDWNRQTEAIKENVEAIHERHPAKTKQTRTIELKPDFDKIVDAALYDLQAQIEHILRHEDRETTLAIVRGVLVPINIAVGAMATTDALNKVRDALNEHATTLASADDEVKSKRVEVVEVASGSARVAHDVMLTLRTQGIDATATGHLIYVPAEDAPKAKQLVKEFSLIRTGNTR